MTPNETEQKQGHLIEQDLGITHPPFKKRLVRSIYWKLFGMGEDPKPPANIHATNATCGSISIEWDEAGAGDEDVVFPVHKYVLKRCDGALAKPPPGGAWAGAGAGAGRGNGGLTGGGDGRKWTTVMDGPNRAFFDTRLTLGSAYTYSLVAWNALGHS
ncbi:unnamed protein product, partial [Discosporangium mesarthrocarpum]